MGNGIACRSQRGRPEQCQVRSIFSGQEFVSTARTGLGKNVERSERLYTAQGELYYAALEREIR